MPLVRKPTDRPPTPQPEASETLRLLTSANAEERWAAARAAAQVEGGVSAIAAALPAEHDPRVREAMLTSLAREGTSESTDALIGLLRSDSANSRTGALDALRIMAGDSPELLRRLLQDPEADIRILSCELARALPNAEATRLLCALLDGEQEVNVCAAAVDVLAEVGSSDALATLQECARRFEDSPFIAFAIKIVTDRISSESTVPSRA
jgi:HEAT repeat protein